MIRERGSNKCCLGHISPVSVPGIKHEGHFTTCRVPRRCNKGQIKAPAFPDGAPPELDCSKPKRTGFGYRLGDKLRGSLHQSGGVQRNPGPWRGAQHLCYRLTDCLSPQIPQRHVNPTQRMYPCSSSPRINGPTVEVLPGFVNI